MKSLKPFDTKIKNCLMQKTQEITIDPIKKEKMKNIILNEIEGDVKMSKKFQFHGMKKAGVVVAACLVSLSCIAAPLITSWVSSSHIVFHDFPTTKQVQKEVGFVPKYTQTLPGGFSFTDSDVGNTSLQDANGDAVVTAKEIGFSYTKEGSTKNQYLSLSALQIEKDLVITEDMIKDTHYTKLDYNDITLFYNMQRYKFVPADYQLTDQDKKDEASGELAISYGSDEVEYSNMQSIIWYEEGICYTLLSSNYDLPQEDLLSMAKTIIDQK